MTRIKFCGLSRPEDAAYAASLDAAYVGAILTESRRRVSALHARDIFDAAPSLLHVGVFGIESVPQVLRAASMANLDVIQLHGLFTPDEHAQIRQEFEGVIWSVVAIDADTGAPSADWKDVADFADGLLLDTSHRGHSGGTGRTFDWLKAAPLIREISREIPVILAGGLNPENVSEAVGIARPAVVDVSSGVELSPGVKSPELMTAFARSVASASIV
jgi:phosphoribosylanthranilate isomerase